MAIRQKLLTGLTTRPNETERTIDIQNERLMDEAFAKSFATICTIYSNAHPDEFIHPEYLSRFYYILQQGLRFYHGDEQRSQAIIESILLNSGDLFRINLRGINILIPLYLEVIEYYLQTDLQSYINSHPNLIRTPTNNSLIRDRFIRIRYKCIQILMSIVSLTFHYENLRQYLFEDYLEKSSDVQTTIVKTYGDYRLKIILLLLAALQTEQDTTNAQLLFGTIRLVFSLAAHYERKTDETGKKDTVSEHLSNAVILICEKGTNDSQLFLAALDTLISFITDPMCQLPIDKWKNVLKRLCNFIDAQLHRSPKDHTREMHSTCVATYNALITLITERPILLDDYENLFKLCEITELGISGEKAQTADGLVFKRNKEFHPASQRVAEAAEYLMFVLFEHKAVLHLKNDLYRNWLDESTFANRIPSPSFKYFAINGNTIFAMNELSLNTNNTMPAIILLCRGLFGKNVWTVNFRHQPLSYPSIQQNKPTEAMVHENGKNNSSATNNVTNEQKEKIAPTHVTKTERAKSELSIPTLNSILKRDEDKLNLFRTVKSKQMQLEEHASQRAHLNNDKRLPECKPPECQKQFESIRLFLSHYGFCSLDSMYHLLNGKHWNDSTSFDHIRLLDSNSETFIDDIKKLDRISPTLYCTGHIYYLKKNQNTLNESFSNISSPESLNPNFLKMVSQLGTVIEVKRHCGWTGNPETSWKTVDGDQSNINPNSKILGEINGDDSILYYGDLTTEMVFYLPQQVPGDNQGTDMRILIVWFEEFRADLDSILIQDPTLKSRDIPIIGIHPLKNRLFRISLNSSAQRIQSTCASIPLIDGMVLPISILAFFIRQSVHNLCRRKRLEDSQSTQTAYSIRKTRITKIIEKYQDRSNNLDDFFQNIFFLSSSTNKPNPMIIVQS